MIDLSTRYRRVISLIISLALALGVFISCNKGPVDVLYVIGLVTENTAPKDVKDPEMHETYVTLLGELNSELAGLMGSTTSPFLGEGVSLTKTGGIELDPTEIRSEDEKRIAVYNDYLSGLKSHSAHRQ